MTKELVESTAVTVDDKRFVVLINGKRARKVTEYQLDYYEGRLVGAKLWGGRSTVTLDPERVVVVERRGRRILLVEV